MNEIWRRIRPLLSNFVRFMHISYLEAKSDYEGTTFGVLWMPISTLLFTALIGLVFHQPGGTMTLQQYFLYVLVGYVCWDFISDTVTRSTSIIQGKLDFAVHNNLTLVGLFAKLLGDRMFEFGLNLALVALVVLVLTPMSYGLQFFLIVPFLALIAATSLGLSYLVNLVTVNYPDVENVIKAIMRGLFFATPIFWSAEDRTDIRAVLETYNPAAYYLMMGRQVFGVEPLAWHVWGIALGITVIVAALSWYAYQRSHAFVRNLK